MWVVRCDIVVTDDSVAILLPKEVRDRSVDTAVSDGHGTLADADVQLPGEHILVGEAVILHPVEEIKHFLRNIVPTQIIRVLIAPFIVMLLEPRLQHCSGQLGIGHTHGLNLIQTSQLADIDLVLEVVLPKLDDLLGGIHIMLTIEYGGLQFLRGERSIQSEVNFRFADSHAEVAFDGLQGKTHLHIIFDIDIVEPEADTTQQGTFPALVTGDDPVIDLLDLFRDKTSADGFYNVLVISLAIETAVDSVIVNTRPECLAVVMDDREVLGFVVLEDYYPVIGEDLAVIGY